MEDETRQDKKKAVQVDARKIGQDKAWQAKTTLDTRQDTTDKTRKTVTVNYILPVLFLSSHILIEILVLSGYHNIGIKDGSQKDWLVVAKISHLHCSLYYIFFTNF
jgi:hypothetical protein